MFQEKIDGLFRISALVLLPGESLLARAPDHFAVPQKTRRGQMRIADPKDVMRCFLIIRHAAETLRCRAASR